MIQEKMKKMGFCDQNGQPNQEQMAKKMEEWGKKFGEKMAAWGQNGGCGMGTPGNWGGMGPCGPWGGRRGGHHGRRGGHHGGPFGGHGPFGHHGPFGGHHGGPHGPPPHHGPHGGPGGGGHKINRCRVVKGPESGSVTGTAGSTVFIEAQFRNNTYYPLKPGCQLMSLEQDGTQVIDNVKMQVEQINGMTDFTLNIPVKIRADAQPGAHDIMFQMMGPRGWNFGETLIVNLTILEKANVDDMEVFKKVKAFIEKH